MDRAYEMTVSADDCGILVSVDGRLSVEVGRQLREIRAAAARCGIPLRVDLIAARPPEPR